MNEEKKEQNKRNVKRNVLLACAVVGVSLAVGIAIGDIRTGRNVVNATRALWAKDPTLKDHMLKVMTEISEEQKV